MSGLNPNLGEIGPWYYGYGGLRVLSELRLPEWGTFQVPAWEGEPDARIVLGAEDFTGTTPRITPTEYCFRVAGVGAFQIRDGREVIVTPEKGTPVRKLRPFVIGSGWGTLCYQRGILIIHASAVRVGDSAMLFCARSGGGKSTLAAQLGARGYPLVSDDLCRITIPSGAAPIAYPAAPRLKLWTDALNKLGLDSGAMEADHARPGKFHFPGAAPAETEALPIGGIYLLEWGEQGIRRVAGLAAFRRFLSAGTWRPKLLESMGLVSGHAQRCMEVAQRVPMWEFSRPQDLPMAGDAVAFLERQWGNAGVS